MCYIDPHPPWMPKQDLVPFVWPKDYEYIPPTIELEPITSDLSELEHLNKQGLLRPHEKRLLDKLRETERVNAEEQKRQDALNRFRASKLKATKKGK